MTSQSRSNHASEDLQQQTENVIKVMKCATYTQRMKGQMNNKCLKISENFMTCPAAYRLSICHSIIQKIRHFASPNLLLMHNFMGGSSTGQWIHAREMKLLPSGAPSKVS